MKFPLENILEMYVVLQKGGGPQQMAEFAEIENGRREGRRGDKACDCSLEYSKMQLGFY